jgi:hypothetical protein
MAERKTTPVDDWKDVPSDDWKDVTPNASPAAKPAEVPLGDQSASVGGVIRSLPEAGLDVGKGVIKGIGRSIYDTGSAVINPMGNNPVANYIDSKTGISKKIHDITEPSNMTQRISGYLPDVAMSLIPGGAVEQAGKMLPNVESAGRKFGIVQNAMKGIPVNIDAAAPAALRAEELRQASFARPPILKNVLGRLSPGAEAPTFRETSDLASNAGKLSTQESMRVKPQMQAQVNALAQALKESNQAAADAQGVGDVYKSAIDEYRRAKKIEGAKNRAVEIAKKWLIPAAATGAAGTVGYKIAKAGLGGD